MKHSENYLGKRIKRGLFSSSTGTLLNADVNGALGIMIKGKRKSLNKGSVVNTPDFDILTEDGTESNLQDKPALISGSEKKIPEKKINNENFACDNRANDTNK